MAVTNILQTLAVPVAALDVDGLVALPDALDGQQAAVAQLNRNPLFACTANNTAAEAIAFLFTGATLANLNLAVGESRVLTAKFRGTGPTAAGCGAASLDFIVINVASALTIAGAANVPYGTAGATTSFTMAATATGGNTNITVTVTTGTGGVGPNNVCELYLNGAKGK